VWLFPNPDHGRQHRAKKIANQSRSQPDAAMAASPSRIASTPVIIGATSGPPEHPLHQLAALRDEGTEEIGPTLVRRFLEHWDGGGVFEPLLTLWRSAAIQPQARKVLHDALAGPMAQRVAAELGVSNAELRVELVACHLMGLAFARYQLKIEPIASTSIEDIVAWAGPTVQRYLTDPRA
jgi:Tetracyclin repressor-like, C-terminal domain